MWGLSRRRRNKLDELLDYYQDAFDDILNSFRDGLILLEEIKFSSQCIESHMGCDGHPVTKINEADS